MNVFLFFVVCFTRLEARLTEPESAVLPLEDEATIFVRTVYMPIQNANTFYYLYNKLKRNILTKPQKACNYV